MATEFLAHQTMKEGEQQSQRAAEEPALSSAALGSSRAVWVASVLDQRHPWETSPFHSICKDELGTGSFP